MAVETANYVAQLDQTYPPGNTPSKEGDDHIRLIKKTLKQTFPNLTGAMTLTHAQLNALLKNEANGVAGLDSTGRVAKAQQHAATTYNDASAVRTHNIIFNDGVGAHFGTDADAVMYHDDTALVVTNTKGTFYLQNKAAGQPTCFRASADGTNYVNAIAFNSGTAELYSGGGLKLATTGDGVGITGNAYMTGQWWVNYSDERLKEELDHITDPLGLCRNIKLIRYKANAVAEGFGYDSSKIEIGVTASSVEAVMPELVAIAPFDRDGEGKSKSGENYRTVDYSRMAAVAVAAIGQLEEKLAWEAKARGVLERQLMEMQVKIQQLEARYDAS